MSFIYQIEYGAIAACADMVKIRISFAYDCFPNKKLSCDYMGDFITALVLAFPFGGNTAGLAVLHNSAYILLDLIRLYGAVILRRIVFQKSSPHLESLSPLFSGTPGSIQ